MKTGFNALFIPGPTNMPFRVRQAMDVALEDMRAPDFGDFTKPIFEDTKKVFRSETGQVFIFPGSGTGGWESAIANTLSPGDKVLMSRFGQFSHLWVDMCQRFGLDVQCIEVEWGKGVPLDAYEAALKADTRHEIKAVFACQNETATGVTSDIAGVRRALDAARHPALLMVDGVSSVGSIDMRMEEWGVDVCVSGSQKGFMLPTGLAIICVSQKALAMQSSARLPRTFFSWEDMSKLNADGYFPYTPATTLLRGLRASLDMIFEEGLDNVIARHHHLAEGVRRGVLDGWKLDLCARGPEWYSDTVSAILVPEEADARQVIARAYERYNLSLGTGLAKVMGRVFRIGHLGWLNEVMVAQALAGAEMAMRDCGIMVEPGSGVGAATEYWRTATGNTMAQAAE
ncbi:aminotransferase class V-fold PLP-dependent enzyme [Paralimibaculum aggregatum]|uniref:Aminotransferase class V-fold PLP-dependent enzyme n=1 Tax=Paralimibaculum aggregatum TaxID=3036245 RepID=A0ABQ6LHJ4_9RHOB|nr:aminotransferase class V-fold PLP-dependent enzyme [Limibaculum sp. NKW23]GMG82756.1 aminotransferase class V-fold PLP-dependent enzyme [Limibaculum sp. NKW23]